MPKYPNISEETTALQRREAMETRPQDRYAGRRKFQFCHVCGSWDGMQITHRETLARMKEDSIAALAPWYSALLEEYYLFCACRRCNAAKVIPTGYRPMSLDSMLTWLNRDPTAPDYAPLAAEEPVSQVEDSRDSAGI